MAEELQKHHLLVKLLKMSTSINDGEALVAIRKANNILAEAGWDWDRLMAGKITVVGDPFAGLGDPRPKQRMAEPTYRDYSPPPKPNSPPPKTTSHPIGGASNKFDGHCYCCGVYVPVGSGFIFRPIDHHSRATASWKVVCNPCNMTGVVGPSPAPRQGRGARKTTADDLA